jgi:cell division protein FtsW
VKPKYFAVAVLLLIFSIVCLLITPFVGIEINGARRYLGVGGFSFQPSELAKLCLVGTVAFLLSKRNARNDTKIFWWITGLTAVTCGIIFVDNGSTAIMLALVIFIMMWIGQVSSKNLLKLLLLGAVAVVLLGTVVVVFPKVFPRGATWIERFKDYGADEDIHSPDFEINDDNFQVSHANIAIANGFPLPKWPGGSVERHYLPQAYSDFIYSIIIEEMGLLGVVLIPLLYLILFIRAGQIANRSDKLFSKFLVMGCSLVLLIQALANMSVAVGLMPVTGQTLPLISRGGTSTIITCIYFGIILSVSRFENPNGAKREEEIATEYVEAKNETITDKEETV